MDPVSIDQHEKVLSSLKNINNKLVDKYVSKK